MPALSLGGEEVYYIIIKFISIGYIYIPRFEANKIDAKGKADLKVDAGEDDDGPEATRPNPGHAGSVGCHYWADWILC